VRFDDGEGAVVALFACALHTSRCCCFLLWKKNVVKCACRLNGVSSQCNSIFEWKIQCRMVFSKWRSHTLVVGMETFKYKRKKI
jgi:hypothetical protein